MLDIKKQDIEVWASPLTNFHWDTIVWRGKELSSFLAPAVLSATKNLMEFWINAKIIFLLAFSEDKQTNKIILLNTNAYVYIFIAAYLLYGLLKASLVFIHGSRINSSTWSLAKMWHPLISSFGMRSLLDWPSQKDAAFQIEVSGTPSWDQGTSWVLVYMFACN